MKEELIQSILEDIYLCEPSLRSKEEEVKVAIKEFIKAGKEISVRPEFAAELRRRVLLVQPKQSLFIHFINNFAMNYRKIAMGGVALAAVALVATGVLTRPARTLGAELAYTEGAVLYRTDGSVWQEATKDTTLKQGDGVKIIGVGRAIVILDDGSAVRLSNDSEVTLASLDPAHLQIINEKGQVYTRVVKAKRLFDVNVDNLIYRSLGTAYMTVNTDETQGVEVYQSAVQVIDTTSKSENNTEAVVPEGSSYYDVNVEAPKKIGEITAIDPAQVEQNDFVVWNKEQDTSDEKFDDKLGVLAVVGGDQSTAVANVSGNENTETAPAFSGTADGISLSAVGTRAVTWVAPAGSGTNGYKVVYSKTSAPTYPTRSNDQAIYVDVGTTLPWLYAFDGSGDYSIRVCEYKADGTCGAYSNEVSLSLVADGTSVAEVVSEKKSLGEEIKTVKNEAKEEIKTVKEELKSDVKALVVENKDKTAEFYPGTPGASSVTSITLVANSPEPEHVSWTTEGSLVSGMGRGVRVLFSKNPSPTYGSSMALPVGYKNYAKIYAKEGTGTYYVRVCEFLGDRCGTYSNEVTVTVRGGGAGGEYFENGEWKSNRTVNGPAASGVSSITLTANDPAIEHVSWTVNGTIVQGMDRGVRVIYSKSPNPTLGAAGTIAQPVGYKRYTKVWSKFGSGTYYVRACEYLGSNTCGTYSNEITMTLGEPGSSGGEYKGERIREYMY